MNARLLLTRFATAFLAAVLLTGCAFGTRQPTLTYPPAPETGATEAIQPAAPAAAKNITILLNDFSDERSDKSVVGTVRNGFGMCTADVVPTNSVPDWVTQAIALELKDVGYPVVRGKHGASGKAGEVVVSGEILNVFCDMYMSYTGQISLVAKVSNSNGELFSRHYAGEGSAGLAWAATGESYAQSLALALRSAIRRFVADLATKLPEQ